MKLIIMLSVTFLIAACGKNSIVMSHTIPTHNPAEKPTADCQNAEMGVWRLVNRDANYDSKSVIPLGNGGCAVVVNVKSPATVVRMLDAIRDTSTSYSYYTSETLKVLVNVWVQQTPMTFKDTKGNVIDTFPSDANCNAARDKLAATFDNTVATFLTVIDRKGAPGARRCYVDAIFTGKDHKTNFEHFMAWNNPTGNHEPFNYYVTDGTSPKVVYIHAVDAFQK